VPSAEGRAEVAKAVNARAAELRLSTAELARLSGLAVNTVRGGRDATGKYTKSTLVALSAVLDCDPQYLWRILFGQARRTVTTGSPLKAHLAELAHGLADVRALRQEVARLTQEIAELRHAWSAPAKRSYKSGIP
jgi:hypothetical protein